MKKQILPIALLLLSFVLIGGSVNAQCTTDNTITQPGVYATNKTTFRQNAWSSVVWQFKNFDQITALGNSVSVDSIKFDSIINLPCGLKWTTNKQNSNIALSDKFTKLENGCLWIYGVATDSIGSFNTDIYVTAYVHGLGAIPQHLSTIGSYVRTNVVDSSDFSQSAADTTNLKTPSCSQAERTYTSSNAGIGSISENVANLTNYPNPFGNSTSILFTAGETQKATFRVYDLVGKTLHEENITVVAGSNIIDFNRDGLTNGIYFYSISDGKHSITSKMIIAE